jgi:EAL domain-containing protein (putative c-di-GMP-specific phosphodiesterase class I)
MEAKDTSPRTKPATFGRRKLVPRSCIVDARRHIRTFLRQALEEFGFLVCECDAPNTFARLLGETVPELVMLSASDAETRKYLDILASEAFDGRVLLFGPPASPLVVANRELGAALGLATLPLLATPFSADALEARVAPLKPAHAPPNPPVEVAEALQAGWLELWYQPKIDARSLLVAGAEALVRLRHPTWGVVAPAGFIADEHDPHFIALSDFVIARAMEDWHYFIAQYGRVEIAIKLPGAYYHGAGCIARLGLQMPSHPAFEGLIVEMNGSDILADLDRAKLVARQLRFANIGVSIDELGAEWPAFIGTEDFPFVEIKVDRAFVSGCATDRLKQAVCRGILELAGSFGVRTVAEGIERQADLVAARDMGFDLLQGFLFAKPRPARDFARRSLQRPALSAP